MCRFTYNNSKSLEISNHGELHERSEQEICLISSRQFIYLHGLRNKIDDVSNEHNNLEQRREVLSILDFSSIRTPLRDMRGTENSVWNHLMHYHLNIRLNLQTEITLVAIFTFRRARSSERIINDEAEEEAIEEEEPVMPPLELCD